MNLWRDLSVVVVGVAMVGCGAAGEESEVDMTDEVGEETPAPEAADFTAVPVEWCQDLVLHETQLKFCGPQTGPLDDSPVNVKCTRTCVTERHAAIQPGFPPKTVCITDDTDCTAWVCPSCD